MECKNKSMKTFQEFRKDALVNESVGGIVRDMAGGAIGNKIYNNITKKREGDKYSTKTKDYTAGSGSIKGDIASYVGGSAVTNALWTGAKKAVGAYMAYRMTR